ncbi:hypothetical protein IX38_08290 [Chryseobacterium luteum]|uniref:Uncharacterized protein n=1 Tax=Chryseobacterium luteum TaxID=421531 RepID=A0A085ZUL5_9FLAO|nr:hypothetical protein IX38_08290 [Chryseobacterium luteum]
MLKYISFAVFIKLQKTCEVFTKLCQKRYQNVGAIIFFSFISKNAFLYIKILHGFGNDSCTTENYCY